MDSRVATLPCAMAALCLALAGLRSPSSAEGDDAGSRAWKGVALVVYKQARRLAVYRDGRFEREVPVVLGLSPMGRKRHAHDARTPEGAYHVVASSPHPRWQFFLALDYPNAADRAAYAGELARGRIPDDDGRPFGIGSELGIHGTDRVVVQEAGIDWTHGCVALAPGDIRALAAVAVPGTPVWIVE